MGAGLLPTALLRTTLVHMSVGRCVTIRGPSLETRSSTLRRNQILFGSFTEAQELGRVPHIGIFQTVFG